MSSCSNFDILSATLSKTQKQVTLSVRFIPKKDMSEIPVLVYYEGWELRLQSYTKAPNGTIQASYSSGQLRQKRFLTGKIYKSIPKGIYETLKNTCQIQRLLPVPELDTFGGMSGIVFKLTDDEYGANGFTAYEILSDLGIDVCLPPLADYNVVEFAVRKGSTYESVIRSLLPIPMIINFLSEDTFEVNPNHLYLPSFGCLSSISTVERIDSVDYFIMGGLGEPRYVSINQNACELANREDIEVVFNRFGSIYGIVRERYEITEETQPSTP